MQLWHDLLASTSRDAVFFRYHERRCDRYLNRVSSNSNERVNRRALGEAGFVQVRIFCLRAIGPQVMPIRWHSFVLVYKR